MLPDSADLRKLTHSPCLKTGSLPYRWKSSARVHCFWDRPQNLLRAVLQRNASDIYHVLDSFTGWKRSCTVRKTYNRQASKKPRRSANINKWTLFLWAEVFTSLHWRVGDDLRWREAAFAISTICAQPDMLRGCFGIDVILTSKELRISGWYISRQFRSVSVLKWGIVTTVSETDSILIGAMAAPLNRFFGDFGSLSFI